MLLLELSWSLGWSFRTRVEERLATLVLRAATGVECIPQAIAEEIEGEHREDEQGSWEDHQERSVGVEPTGDGVGNHAPPRWNLKRQAEAEVGQRRLSGDRTSDRQAGIDRDRTNQLWQEVAQDDARVARTQHAGGGHKLAVTQSQHLATKDTAGIEPREERDDQDHEPERRPECH